jgi:hypothetical protein
VEACGRHLVAWRPSLARAFHVILGDGRRRRRRIIRVVPLRSLGWVRQADAAETPALGLRGLWFRVLGGQGAVCANADAAQVMVIIHDGFGAGARSG